MSSRPATTARGVISDAAAHIVTCSASKFGSSENNDLETWGLELCIVSKERLASHESSPDSPVPAAHCRRNPGSSLLSKSQWLTGISFVSPAAPCDHLSITQKAKQHQKEAYLAILCWPLDAGASFRQRTSIAAVDPASSLKR